MKSALMRGKNHGAIYAKHAAEGFIEIAEQVQKLVTEGCFKIEAINEKASTLV